MMWWRFSLFLVLVSSLSLCLAQPVPTPANIVCFQEVVASQGTYEQIDTSLRAWSQKMFQTLGLTGPLELAVGWARVPDRTGFENNCTGPYPNIADLFVHIQTTGGSNFDSISSALESFIAANPLTSQPNIVCSARSIVTFLPGCGKTGAAGLNNATLIPPTNATGNATTSAPTSPSNATIAPTTTPTLAPNATTAPTTAAPSNVTIAPTTAAPSNATIAPTTAAPSNATISPTTAAPSNVTSAPTNATSNSTIAPTTAAPSNGTVLPTLVPTIRPNATTGGNSTNSTTAPTTTPVASNDLQATGTVSANGAQPIMTGIGMSISIIVSIITIML